MGGSPRSTRGTAGNRRSTHQPETETNLPDRAPAAPPADPAGTCPHLRAAAADGFDAPVPRPDPANRCTAAGDRPIGARQQALVCLSAAHLDCPRFPRRGHATVLVAVRGTTAPRGRAAIALPTVLASIVLVASLVAAFAFTASRGSLSLPTVPPTGSAVAAGSPSVLPTATPSSVPSTQPSASLGASQTGGPGPSAAPSPAPSAPAGPSPSGSATPPPVDPRLALLSPCPDRSDCYLYTVRRGDTLLGIAKYFGVPYAEIRRLNPEITDPSTIRVGQRIRIPTPG